MPGMPSCVQFSDQPKSEGSTVNMFSLRPKARSFEHSSGHPVRKGKIFVLDMYFRDPLRKLISWAGLIKIISDGQDGWWDAFLIINHDNSKKDPSCIKTRWEPEWKEANQFYPSLRNIIWVPGFLGGMKILILWVRHLSSVFTDAHPIQQQNSPNWPTSNYESEVPEFGQVWEILEIQASFPINLQSCSVLSDKPSRPDDCWPRNKHRKMPKDPRSTTVRQGHGNLWAVLQDHSQPQNDLDVKRAKPWVSFVVIINATVMPLISLNKLSNPLCLDPPVAWLISIHHFPFSHCETGMIPLYWTRSHRRFTSPALRFKKCGRISPAANVHGSQVGSQAETNHQFWRLTAANKKWALDTSEIHGLTMGQNETPEWATMPIYAPHLNIFWTLHIGVMIAVRKAYPPQLLDNNPAIHQSCQHSLHQYQSKRHSSKSYLPYWRLPGHHQSFPYLGAGPQSLITSTPSRSPRWDKSAWCGHKSHNSNRKGPKGNLSQT